MGKLGYIFQIVAFSYITYLVWEKYDYILAFAIGFIFFMLLFVQGTISGVAKMLDKRFEMLEQDQKLDE